MRRCLQAWHSLSSCRPIGMSGAVAIPWTAIMEWCDRKGLDEPLTDLVVTVIERLDADRAEAQASKG